MKNVPFGRTGLSVSVLGFGGAPIGYLQTDRQRVSDILNQMLDAGVNLIDTAASYKGSEELIAETIGDRRKQFVLVSKCGGALDDVDAPAWSAELVTKTVDRSLRRLKTDALDVMLLHSCDLETLKKGEALGALVEAQKKGKVKFPGYSGDNEAAAYAAGLGDVYVIETSVNITDQANIDAVLPACRKHNVGVLAKRPIANAAWKRIEQQPGMYQNYARTYTDRFGQMGLTPQGLGFKGDGDWSEIALRFTLSQPGVGCAIIGTTNPDNARNNVAAAEKGPLAADAVQKIREAFAEAEKAAGQKWTGQT